jgi:hypothetical protein
VWGRRGIATALYTQDKYQSNPNPQAGVLLRASPTALPTMLLSNNSSVPIGWSSDGDTLLLQGLIAIVVRLGDSTPLALPAPYGAIAISRDGQFVLADQGSTGSSATTLVSVQVSTGDATVLARRAASASWSR